MTRSRSLALRSRMVSFLALSTVALRARRKASKPARATNLCPRTLAHDRLARAAWRARWALRVADQRRTPPAIGKWDAGRSPITGPSRGKHFRNSCRPGMSRRRPPPLARELRPAFRFSSGKDDGKTGPELQVELHSEFGLYFNWDTGGISSRDTRGISRSPIILAPYPFTSSGAMYYDTRGRLRTVMPGGNYD
jgi:hypothetical protein